jgi:hypothetical protein
VWFSAEVLRLLLLKLGRKTRRFYNLSLKFLKKEIGQDFAFLFFKISRNVTRSHFCRRFDKRSGWVLRVSTALVVTVQQPNRLLRRCCYKKLSQFLRFRKSNWKFAPVVVALLLPVLTKASNPLERTGVVNC